MLDLNKIWLYWAIHHVFYNVDKMDSFSQGVHYKFASGPKPLIFLEVRVVSPPSKHPSHPSLFLHDSLNFADAPASLQLVHVCLATRKHSLVSLLMGALAAKETRLQTFV